MEIPRDIWVDRDTIKQNMQQLEKMKCDPVSFLKKYVLNKNIKLYPYQEKILKQFLGTNYWDSVRSMNDNPQ